MDDLVDKLGVLSRNVKRAYPLLHTASRIDDVGNVLPDYVIAELSLRYLPTLGSQPFISYVSVTAALCSCGISVLLESGSRLIAHVISPRTAAWTPHNLIALVDGVSGSIVFGDLPEELQVRFSSPAQTAIVPSAARVLPRDILQTVQVQQFDKMTGVIELKPARGITIRTSPVYPSEFATVPEATAILIGLDTSLNNSSLVSDCAKRPESGNCGNADVLLPAIETVNDIRVGCGRTIDVEVVNGSFISTAGRFSMVYTPTISQLCSDRTRNPNIAAVLDECQRPLVEVSNCDSIPAYYDMKIQESSEARWQKNWLWQYGEDSYSLTPAGLSAAVQTSDEISFVNMVGIYDSCGYRVCGNHLLELDISVPPVHPLLPNIGRCGVLLNYMQNAWLYSLLAGDDVQDPGLRVGFETRVKTLPTDTSPGEYTLWLCVYKNETEIINSVLVGDMRPDTPLRYQLRVELLVTVWEREIPIKTRCRAQLFRLSQGDVLAPLFPGVLETELTFFGPYVGKYGVYADNVSFHIESFRLSDFIAV